MYKSLEEYLSEPVTARLAPQRPTRRRDDDVGDGGLPSSPNRRQAPVKERDSSALRSRSGGSNQRGGPQTSLNRRADLPRVVGGGGGGGTDSESQPTAARRLNAFILDANVEAYREELRDRHPFSPTLAPRSVELDATSPSLRMAYARQRRRDAMLSPPRSMVLYDRRRLHRSGSTVSSVWGADSEIVAAISAIRPPSEAGGGRGRYSSSPRAGSAKGGAAPAPAVPLAITEKARKMDRSLKDLFEWQALKEEAAGERAAAAEAARAAAEAAEDAEVFAFREQEYKQALARYLAKKARRAAKRRKVSDYFSIGSSSPFGAGGTSDAGGGAESDATRLSDAGERFRALHAPSHVTAESARLVAGMGDRRIDAYDHAEMVAQAKGQAAIEARLLREAEKSRWRDEEDARLALLRERRREQRALRRAAEEAEEGGFGVAPFVTEGAVEGRGVSQLDLEWFRARLWSDPAYH